MNQELEIVERPWGWYEVVYQTKAHWTKIITVNPGQSLSLQYHNNRNEFWVPLDKGLKGFIVNQWLELQPGARYAVLAGQVHRISNPTEWHACLVEVAEGAPTEDDIVRLEDDYGR